jgi:KTSC domain
MSFAALARPLTNSSTVDSSFLAALAYDNERSVLQVEFLDRTVYQYLAVPRNAYEELCQAQSKGVHFNRHIRNQFASAKLSGT